MVVVHFDAVGVSTKGEGIQENLDRVLRVSSQILRAGDFDSLPDLVESPSASDELSLKDNGGTTWDCIKSGVGYVLCGVSAGAACSTSAAQVGANPITDTGCVLALFRAIDAGTKSPLIASVASQLNPRFGGGSGCCGFVSVHFELILASS